MKYLWTIPFLVAIACLGCGPSASSTKSKAEAKSKSVAKDGDQKADLEIAKAPLVPSKSAEEITAHFESLSKGFIDEFTSARNQIRSADPGEQQQLAEKLQNMPSEFSEKFMKLANDYPKSPEAPKSLMWVMTNVRPIPPQLSSPDRVDYHTMAKEKLFRDFKDSEEMAVAIPLLLRSMPDANIVNTLTDLKDNSPHDRVKGTATMALVEFYDLAANFKKAMSQNPQITANLPRETTQFLQNLKIPDSVEDLLDVIVKEYPDFEYGMAAPGAEVPKLGDLAENRLFALRNLQVGKMAPDIIGKDLDEIEFKLSDYRGKVVMLDFWGDW